MQKLISLLLLVIFLLPNYLQAQEFENVLWWKALEDPAGVWNVAISPDGNTMVTLTHKLKLWNANTGDFILECEIGEFFKNVEDIYFSKDGKYIYTDSKMRDGYFNIWEVETGKIKYSKYFVDNVFDAKMSNDGTKIAIYGHDRLLRIYNFITWELLAERQLKEYVKGGIEYSPDDKYILHAWTSNSEEQHGVYFLDANTLEYVDYLPQHMHESATSDVAFSRDGKYLLVYTSFHSYGQIPTSIYSYPDLEELDFDLDYNGLSNANFYVSPCSYDFIADFESDIAYSIDLYIFRHSDKKPLNNKKLGQIPFFFLRDTDTSGSKMPGFYPRIKFISTTDTIGVFLPPWNKTKVKEKEEIKEDKIYPNPSTNTAEISFTIANAEDISVLIYDNSGRVIQTLHQGLLEAGEHTFSWDCSNVGAGKYICNIRGNSVFKSLKVMINK